MCNKKSIHSMIMDVLINSVFIAWLLLNGLHSEMVLDVPELREGIPGNITCSVGKLKHPATIELSLDNKPLSEIEQQNIYDAASGTYASIKTMTDIDRSWNGKSLKCMSYTLGPAGTYMFHAFKIQTVIYKYPPSSMRMITTKTPINMLPWYPLTLECVAHDTNADCRITWVSEFSDLNLISAIHVGHQDILSTLHVNVSQSDSGHTISCHTKCVGFADTFTKVYAIDLPRPPTIRFRPINKTGTTRNLALKCEVDSNPIGNISWIATQNNYTETKCDNLTICLLQLNGTTFDSVTQYACLAVNIHGQDYKRVNSADDRDTATEGSEGKLVFMNALIMSVVSVVVCFGLCLGCFIYKRLTRSNEVIRPKAMRSDVATNFQSSTPGNASVQHEIHEPRYANNIASILDRSFTQVDREGQLIYADIDIEFLEQNRVARSPADDNDHTVYTSVRFSRGTELYPQ